jgi:hypothetical protein
MKAAAERGAHFHPTIGVVTPSGFTTSHPRAETMMFLRTASLCLPVPRSEGCNPSSLRSLTLRKNCQSSPRVCPLSIVSAIHLILSHEVACGTIFLALIRPDVPTDGRFTIPSLIKTSAYQSASH